MSDSISITPEVVIQEQEETVAPSVVLDVTMEGCECSDCKDLDYSEIPTPGENTPPTLPSFVPPVISVFSQTTLTHSLVPTIFSYSLSYQQNNGGSVSAVRVYVNAVLVHTGALSGSFEFTFGENPQIDYEVDYLAGPPGYDSQGNMVINPIEAGTLTLNGDVLTTRLPIYGDSAVDENSIPGVFINPQSSGFYLNTGTVNKFFWFAVPEGTVIDRIEDEGAMYLSLKSLFTLLKTVTFTGEVYEVYRMSNAIPYNTNHKFNLHVS